MGTHNCDKNAFCRDTTDNYTCTCKLGYCGDGLTCASESRARHAVYTLEPPNNRHIGTFQLIVPCREVVLISEVNLHTKCPSGAF